MRLACLLWLAACTAGGPQVTCSTDPPEIAASRLADELGRDGWQQVRVLPHPRIPGQVNVVARRGDLSLSARVEPGCAGSQSTVVRVRGAALPAGAGEVGPGGPGTARVSTF